MCDKGVLTEITGRVCSAAREVLGDKLEKVILYGSYARGDYDEYSDVDIFVLADIAQEDCCDTSLSILRRIKGVSLEHDILICPHVTGSATFYKYLGALPFYTNVLKDGVELYAA
jgi:tRNA nucleotidyltransferase (CCA-adding enzyme)